MPILNDRFPPCHAITAAWEGGWSDHPADPGGKTMYGVTQAIYDADRKARGLAARSVRLITRDEALSIYRRDFWIPCGAPALNPGVDLAVYDAAVNSGVSRAKTWLRKGQAASDMQTVKAVCAIRLGFVQSLKIWKSFGKGWARRIADIEVKGVAMVLAASGANHATATAVLASEGKVAEAKAKNAKAISRSGTGGVAATGGASVLEPSSLDTTMILLLVAFGLVMAAIALFFWLRQRAQAARAEAYADMTLVAKSGEA